MPLSNHAPARCASLQLQHPPTPKRTTEFSSTSLVSSLEGLLTEAEVNDKKKWPIRIATKHLVKPGACRLWVVDLEWRGVVAAAGSQVTLVVVCVCCIVHAITTALSRRMLTRPLTRPCHHHTPPLHTPNNRLPWCVCASVLALPGQEQGHQGTQVPLSLKGGR